MAVSSPYANEARKQVGRYLVEQAGYSKKTAQNFYKHGHDILTRVYLHRSRGITQLYVGIVPLYIPDSLDVLFATDVTMELLPGCILLDDDSAFKAKAWAEKIITFLSSGILVFMESISDPQALLNYLNDRSATDRRFVISPIEAAQLIIFSSAYLGDVSSAIEYAKTAQQKIKKERIDNLASKLAQWDNKIADIRVEMAQKTSKSVNDFDSLITSYEREKRLAIFDAEHNAPSTIQMYEKWIKPFAATNCNCEELFSQIIDHNKMRLNYEKLFFSKMHKRK